MGVSGDMFRGLVVLMWVGICAVPLAVWKLVEIVVYLVRHIRWEP